MTDRRSRPGLWAAAALVAAGAVLGVVLAGGGALPGARAAAPAPTTVGPEWRSFRADVTGIRPGPDAAGLLVQVALPGPDPGCVQDPRIEQLAETKTDIRADVVYSTRPAEGGCEDTVPAELRLTTSAPVADRTVILNADTTNAWHKLGAGWGHCDARSTCTPPVDHCDPAWIGAAVSAVSSGTSRADGTDGSTGVPVSPVGVARACDPDWLVLDRAGTPSRTAFRWSDAGWTSFAQVTSAGCEEIRAANPRFPVALCRTLPAPA